MDDAMGCLVSLRVQHEYWSLNAAPVRFEPTPETARDLNRHNLHIRSEDSALDIYGSAIPAERSRWCFNLAAKNSDLVPATAELAANPGKIFLIKLDGILGAGITADAAHLIQPDASEAAGFPPPHIRPTFGGLGIEPDAEFPGQPITLNFAAPSAIWSYLVIGLPEGAKATLKDIEGKVTFARRDDQALPKGVMARVFDSDQPIKLADNPRQRFRLEFQNRVVDLPAAEVSQLEPRAGGGLGAALYVTV